MAHLLLDDDPKPGQIDNLKALVFGAKSLLSLINDILDYSKIEAGGIDLEHTNFDLHELLKNIADSFRSLQKNDKVIINLKLNEDLPKIISGDPTRLSQILNNLIGNAVKFTTLGSITISANYIGIEENRAKINISVEDTGIGIPKEELERIFDKFSQASSDTTRKFGGTGLGLAITKSLTDLMKGEISVESEIGRGSKFSVEMGFGLGELIGKKASRNVEQNYLPHQKLLLVEDNKMNQLVAGKFLGKWNIPYDVAENGREAIEKLLTNDYQLILMDLHMPEMDGYEATKAIRLLEDNNKRNVPIIALSASVLSSVEDKIHTFGMNDFVSKPFEPEVLFNTIKKYFNED
jgi:CheY-like chemotaxis protein